jgi:hypothetical protein
VGGGSLLAWGFSVFSSTGAGDLSRVLLEGSCGGGLDWVKLLSVDTVEIVETLWPEDRRGGRPGRGGGKRPLLFEVGVFGLDGFGRDDGRAGFVSSRFGGRGGSGAPHGGAFTIDPGDLAEDAVFGLSVLVVVDRDTSEAKESAEGLRGGSDGASWLELLRAGKGGGTFGCCLAISLDKERGGGRCTTPEPGVFLPIGGGRSLYGGGGVLELTPLVCGRSANAVGCVPKSGGDPVPSEPCPFCACFSALIRSWMDKT